MEPKPLVDAGAGFTSKPPAVKEHPAGPVQHGTVGQIERAFTAASTFFSGILAYVITTSFHGAIANEFVE